MNHLIAFVAYFAALLIVADLYRRIRSLQSCVSVLANRALKVNSELWRMQRANGGRRGCPPMTTPPPAAAVAESPLFPEALTPGDVHPFTPDAVVSVSDLRQ